MSHSRAIAGSILQVPPLLVVTHSAFRIIVDDFENFTTFLIIAELVELYECVDRPHGSLDRSSTYSGLCAGEMRARPTPIHLSSWTRGPTESCVRFSCSLCQLVLKINSQQTGTNVWRKKLIPRFRSAGNCPGIPIHFLWS